MAYPIAASEIKRMSAKRRPYRSAIQPPGYWYTPSRKSSAVPNRPIAVIGAPSDCRYLGKKRRQRFSPHPSKNMLVDTATISGVSPKNSRARARRPLADSVEPLLVCVAFDPSRHDFLLAVLSSAARSPL